MLLLFSLSFLTSSLLHFQPLYGYKIKFQAMGKIIYDIQTSEKLNIHGTAREIYEGYEKEQGQIQDVFNAKGLKGTCNVHM